MTILRLLLVIGCSAALVSANLSSSSSLHRRAIDASPRISKQSEIVEGSGDLPKGKIAQAHPDMEVHGSGSPNGAGYGSDDEDAEDEVQGSGGLSSDVVEGSGNVPSVIARPQQTTSTTTTTPASPVAERRPPVDTVDKKKDTTTHAVLQPIEKLPEVDDDDVIQPAVDNGPSVVVNYEQKPTSTPKSPVLSTTTIRGGDDTATQSPFHNMLKPGIFAAVVGGTVVGLLTAVLLVMFIVHRMRKKDEGSYALDEPKPRPYPGYAYTKASNKEFYA